MYVVAVTVHVRPECLEAFVQATLENAVASRREAGNVRFDVLAAEGAPGQFLLYEAYRGADDFARHQLTDHYRRWKETVAPWMAQPRQGVRHTSIFFGDGPG